MTIEKSPFLGTTTDREKAFPGPDFEMTVTQDIYGIYGIPEGRRSSRYTKATVPRIARCINSRCQQGGIDLQMQAVYASDDGSEHSVTYSCSGHEGSPQGRRKGDPCMNSFNITIRRQRV